MSSGERAAEGTTNHWMVARFCLRASTCVRVLACVEDGVTTEPRRERSLLLLLW